MKISQLIKELQLVESFHGDIEVGAMSPDGMVTTKLYVTSEPYYYDGGCYVETSPNNWVRSRNHRELGEAYCYVCAIGPSKGLDAEETFEGVKIPYIDLFTDEEYQRNIELWQSVFNGKVKVDE